LDEKLLWSAEEAAELLGISRATMFKLLHEGVIPSLRIGKLRRIPATTLQAWIERQMDEQGAPAEKCTV
jgi:excisionase family DNA binding protein